MVGASTTLKGNKSIEVKGMKIHYPEDAKCMSHFQHVIAEKKNEENAPTWKDGHHIHVRIEHN